MVAVGFTVTLPPVGGTHGLQAPLSMVTVVALGELHVSVTLPPGATDVGFAVRVMKLTVTVTACLTVVPSLPVAVAV